MEKFEEFEELKEKKTRIINVVYGCIMFCLIIYVLNGAGEYFRASGVTDYYVQLRLEAKNQIFIGVIVIFLITVVWRMIISRLKKS